MHITILALGSRGDVHALKKKTEIPRKTCCISCMLASPGVHRILKHVDQLDLLQFHPKKQRLKDFNWQLMPGLIPLKFSEEPLISKKRLDRKLAFAPQQT